ncbi:MAG: hypothetical protein ACRD0Z_10395 [Acidimicrobiales bacterium]
MARGKFKALRQGEYDEDGEYDEEYDEDAADEYADGEYEGGEEGEYEGEEEYEDDEEGQYEEGEYEGEEEGQYEEGEYEADVEGEYGDDDVEGDQAEPYRPPNALSAIKDAFSGRSGASRPKARPVSGTAEDARRVNYLTTRERSIGFFFGFSLIALGVLVYLSDRHYTMKVKGALTLKDKANIAQVHQAAPRDLLVYAILGIIILAATLSKRRAAVAFAVLFAGLGLFLTGDVLGIAFLGTGLWLIFRVRKEAKEAMSGGRAPATGRRGTQNASSTPTRAGKEPSHSRATTPAAGGRQIGKNNRGSTSRPAPRSSSPAAPSSKRYTPPKPVRRPTAAAPAAPEPANRLTAWLRK